MVAVVIWWADTSELGTRRAAISKSRLDVSAQLLLTTESLTPALSLNYQKTFLDSLSFSYYQVS